ncbi:transcriptional activator DEMETER-like [Brassica napus]|uniref:transcriptional activator DEMETER-like n=1 Tax=Brassica napus TaxID=3708 RepID=UPI00207A617A|nr:transcriptional activator DEMETER-like [Brassica napus]
MSSRGNNPVENQFMGSWAPITPRKPMRGGSSVVVDGGGGQDRNYYTGEREEDPLGRSNVASNSQGGCSNVFELDDLLDTDQMPMSFTSLLSGGDHLFQVPQCGTPASSRPLYNLNSPPTREAVGYLCESSVQSVPSTPSLLCRTGRDNGFLEKMITRTTGQTSDNGMQSVVASSVVNSTEVTEQKDGRRQSDLGFDLNQTPQQKPSKKKKFMPKVYVEGKPIRKPRKPATQEPAKPKATGGGKRKKAQKTNLKESAANKPAIGGDMSNTSLEITGKSCRKALSFDLEKTGDVGLDDSGSEIFQNTSGSNSFTESRDAAGGTSGSWLDSVTQVDKTNGLVAANQPLEASTVVTLPRGSEVNHSRILGRDQQPELFTGNQQRQLPMGNQQRQWPMENQQRQLPMENQQAWLHMKNQLCGFPVGNQQPRLAMGSQEPKYLMGTQRSALASGIQQPGGLQGNNQPMFLNQQTQQTYLPAENQQYGSPSGMQQHVMSTRGQQHGLLLDNQRSNQQPGSSMRGQQTCLPAGNQQHGPPPGMQQHVMSTRGQQHGLLLDNQRSHQQPGSSMRGQQTFLPAGNQQHGSPSGMQQYMSTRGQQHALLLDNQRSHQQPGSSMRGQQTCLPAGNQLHGPPPGMQQHVMSTRGQQHGMLLDNQRSQLLMRNPQPGSSMRGQQTCLLAGNQQYGSLSAMQQPVMSPRQQQHGMLLGNQESQFLMGNQQPGSSMRGQQPCVPLMNRQLGTPKGFTHLNQMVAANMSSSGLRPHPQSQTPATNLYMESVSGSMNGTADTYQRSSIAGYGSSPQDIYQGNERIPSHERSNAEYFDLRKKALSQNSALPTPDNAKHVEARGSKRQYDPAMGHMQNSVAHWPLLQQISQSQDVERQNISTSAKHIDAAKKMRIQKAVQEKLHGVAPEVIDIEDYPTDGARKDKSGVPKTPAKKGLRGRKKAVPPPAQNSADNEKGIVPETPARKGPRGRKKTVPPLPNASEIQVYKPTQAKAPSSRSKAKEKGVKSKQARGQSGELLREDCIAEIIYRLQNLYIGDESREQEQNALAIYKGDGAVVPYETKKKKPRPKVDLDDETTRIWNLLMGKEEKEGNGERNKKKEKWWEEERNVFRGRADSFIARMHLVQGDRRFSPWKGSVVDSVIGVFLTQNVTDHLSSSAFMSLAARFPPKPSSKPEDERNIRSVVVEDPEGCILNLNDTPPWQEKVQTSSDTQVSGVDSGSKEQQRSCSNSGIERFNFLENSSQNLEEEVLSSQDSFDPASWTSQSSGRVGSSSGSKSDAEFSTTRSETKTASGSAQSVQIGSPNLSDERSLLHQESGDVQIQETSNVAQKKPDMTADLVDIEDFGMDFVPTNFTMAREKKGTQAAGKKPTSQWDSLRREVLERKGKKERSKESMDSIDYEAIRRASVYEISDAIKERGMNYMLAVRIKDFLERIVKDHGSVDLEWLRDVHPDKAKDYLLSIRGLGLKSVECIRLLTLHNMAFPVDTNVGRIAVRLGWVPLQPLPESLQLHLLELYPVLESIQKFLWPRLCKLDQPTLYELHYQLITFGKVFCTKSRPNCNACPMRGECRHFASAYASARLALPASEERGLTTATIPVPPQSFPPASIPMMELPPPLESSPLQSFLTREVPSNGGSSEPIIEEPATPEPVYPEITESDIEDAYYNEDPDEIPTIELNISQFGQTLKEHMKNNMELQEGDMSKALVALDPSTTSIPTPKLKNISRLRTEHQVYELWDSHPLLAGMDKREPDDPSPYLLAIWSPGETANSAGQKCGGKASGKLCFDEACSECNGVREANSQTVRGTLLIPCRTAMRGSFPLNGTYFQVNEVFADHESSLEPIDVPRDWIWDLPRRTVYFGTSVTSIFKGMSTEQIQYSFWRGFVCVRGFEPKTRAPRPLMARLHFPKNKVKNKT